MISVIMSVYNERLSWVREAVESVRNQTFRDFEFLIVIDNPDIASDIRAYLEEAQEMDSRIRLLYNERNIGLAMSLNRAIAVASGEYIARMDADDICVLNRFEREMNFLLEQNYDLVYANKINIDEDGQTLYADSPINKDPIRDLPFVNVVIHPSVLVKTDVIKALNGYRNFPSAQDYDLWLRLTDAKYRIGAMNEYLLKYRRRANSVGIAKGLEQFYSAKYIIKLYKERRKSSRDSYSESNLSDYLKRANLTENRKAAFQKAVSHMAKASSFKSARRYVACFAEIVKSLLHFPEFAIFYIGNSLLRKFNNRKTLLQRHSK